MWNVDGKLVPMRFIARDLKSGRIAEARVVDLDLVDDLDPGLFTLGSLQQPELPGF